MGYLMLSKLSISNISRSMGFHYCTHHLSRHANHFLPSHPSPVSRHLSGFKDAGIVTQLLDLLILTFWKLHPVKFPTHPETNERIRPLEKGAHFIGNESSIFMGMFVSFQGGYTKSAAFERSYCKSFPSHHFQVSGVCTPLKKKNTVFNVPEHHLETDRPTNTSFGGLALGERRLYLLLRLGKRCFFCIHPPSLT